PGPLRARRLDRPHRPGCQSLQDHRGVGGARSRAPAGGARPVSAEELSFLSRTTWENHLGNQSVDPLRIYSPETIEQVAAIVRDAEAAGTTVRAVGSGHSWSDVALTTGFLLKTDRLTRVPAPEPDFLRPGWAERRLVRTEAGIRIRELNTHLAGQGLALSNMGGYDHQTVAGVASTSTHGSGIGLGPLNDFAR